MTSKFPASEIIPIRLIAARTKNSFTMTIARALAFSIFFRHIGAITQHLIDLYISHFRDNSRTQSTATFARYFGDLFRFRVFRAEHLATGSQSRSRDNTNNGDVSLSCAKRRKSRVQPSFVSFFDCVRT